METMGKLCRLDDYRLAWREAVKVDAADTTMQVFVDDRTAEAEILLTNDEGEALRIVLSPAQAQALRAALPVPKTNT